MSAFPSKFWHVRSGGSILNDLSLAGLMSDIIAPFREGRAAFVEGRTLRPEEDLRIVQTPHPLAYYESKFLRTRGLTRATSNRLAGMLDVRALPFNGEGTDYTHAILEGAAAQADEGRDIVVGACLRFREVARVLAARRERPFVVSDESDVRDLLCAALRAYCDDVVVEEPIGKIAGVTSSRADIAIESAGVAIEVKLARGGKADQKRIFDELAQDQPRYARWAHLRTLVYLVYDSDKLADPQALRSAFEGERDLGGRRFNLVVALA